MIPVITAEEELQPPRTEEPPTVLKTRRVLVVDDEIEFAKVMSDSLAALGHTVDIAADGEEAWRMVRQADYDCLIVDLIMPRMNGLELYKMIKAWDVRVADRCVFLTGAILDAELGEFVTKSGNPSLRKPVSLDTVQKVISELADSN